MRFGAIALLTVLGGRVFTVPVRTKVAFYDGKYTGNNATCSVSAELLKIL